MGRKPKADAQRTLLATMTFCLISALLLALLLMLELGQLSFGPSTMQVRRLIILLCNILWALALIALSG